MIYRWFCRLNPEPWTSPTASRAGKFVKLHKSAKLRNYQAAVQEEYHVTAGGAREPVDGPITLRFQFSRSTAGHGKPCDLTNLQKATEDALQGHLFTNDRNVRKVVSEMRDQGPTAESYLAVELVEDPTSIEKQFGNFRSWVRKHVDSNASNAFEYWTDDERDSHGTQDS